MIGPSGPSDRIGSPRPEELAERPRLPCTNTGFNCRVHLDPPPTPTIRGDVGPVLADQTGTRAVAREYWSNKTSNIVSDVPSEAMIQPRLWGRFHFQPATR